MKGFYKKIKNIFTQFAVILSFTICSSLCLISCDNSISHNYNLSFKDVDSLGYPIGWKCSQLGTGYLVSIDSMIYQDKKFSTSIERRFGSNGIGVCTYELSAPLKGEVIKLTGYIKTKNVKDGFAGLWMRIEDSNQNVISINNMQNVRVGGTRDWTKYEISLPYNPLNADKIFFGGLLKGSGKVWIDNLQLTVDDHGIESLSLKKQKNADLDKSFIKGSKVNNIKLDTLKTRNLANLGMLWGFLKYYHSRIGSGDINCDAELFRILPSILSCKSINEANIVFENWLDQLGPSKLSSGSDSIGNVQIKSYPNYGFLFSKNNLSQGVISKLEQMRDYHTIINDHYYITLAQEVNNPIFRHELTYSSFAYPDAGYRLLSLFRYWNIINYFYPYRYNINGDWNKTLVEYIPRFIYAADKSEYAMACLELICNINDSHATIFGNPSLDSIIGNMTAPFEAKFIENKLVITKLIKRDSLDLGSVGIGDIITKIDNEAVSTLVDKYISLTPGSNNQRRMNELSSPTGWLLRSNRQVMNLRIQTNKRMNKTVEIHKIPMAEYNSKYLSNSNEQRYEKGYYLIDSNIGYIYPALLKDNDISSIINLFKNTNGIIIDLRCYPKVYMPYSYGYWFKKISSPFAYFTTASLTKPGTFVYGKTVYNGQIDTSNINAQKTLAPTYTGKLVILVNELTISQAEFTAMAFQSIPGTLVIGSQTAGADGNVSKILLPGQISTMISGIGVYYPDSSETQGTGIKIDHIVKPTIAGTKEGKDEVLEFAIKSVYER